MLKDTSEADLEKEISVRDEYEERFLKLKLSIEKNNRDKADKLLNVFNETPRYKLPKIELKKYNGELMEWLGFWSQFSKIHEDTSLAPEDKFQYLIQSTQEGSKAREVVQSFPPTAKNYPKVIESMKERFGQEDILVEVYIRELLKLVIKNVAKSLPIHDVYDKLESAMRALESLGITAEKCAPLLYPLVESSLSEDILRTYRRNVNADPTPTGRLEKLMKFIKTEVDAEQRISMAMDGFGLAKKDFRTRTNRLSKNEEMATASELLVHNESRLVCIFCSKAHFSSDCFIAQKMSFDDKQKALRAKRACFSCLKVGHNAKRCRIKLKCIICSKHHVPLMCPVLSEKKGETQETSFNEIKPEKNLSSLASFAKGPIVVLQTLKITAGGPLRRRPVRALVDTGAQRSYILKETATELGCKSLRQEVIIHSLFGGLKTSQRNHSCYNVKLGNLDSSYIGNFEILDQPIICENVSSVKRGPWMEEARCLNVHITDIDDPPGPIEILIGADLAAKLFTGRQINLSCGLLAIETLLGWTLIGKSPSTADSLSSAMMVTNLLVNELTISDLWKLEAIGICDPAESKKRTEIHQDTLEYYRSTLMINEEGRYEVALPWILESSRLPDNRQIAEKRLNSVYEKLVESDKVNVYTDVFDKWIAEGIIEEVQDKNELSAHYLPHRPVFKESSATTKVRPVFDASSHSKGSLSLNACLETGPNLIELVPSLLNRFRKFPVGITSDIEKAFLQIGIREKDRNYLRFLWKTQDMEMKIYRHRRLVFGVNCSPFLLAATLNHHLEKSPEVHSDTAQILRNSFYVDNCVCSLKNIDEANKFIMESQQLMSSGKFNLRSWQSNAPLEFINKSEGQNVVLLGLIWNLQEDTLSCTINCPKENELILTKRMLLSFAQSIFDPLGFSSPVTIIPKFLLQESWNIRLKWDDALPKDLARRFLNWLKKIRCLSAVKVPRWLKLGKNEENVSLHVFCDASAKAYATCIFLRVEAHHEVTVRFVQSRARVAPLKSITIPRLELLACCIGSRLCASVVEDLKLENLKVFYWTDSSTALSWIKRDSPWGTFVWNRVSEIRGLTDVEQWRHVPGKLNPADLPTRGCSAEQFLHLRWWEGPLWLFEEEKNWPQSTEVADEDLINAEKRKTVLSAHNHTENANYWNHGSSHRKTVRTCESTVQDFEF